MLLLNFDGSCVTNPGGPGGWGWRLCQRTGEEIASGAGYLPPGPDLTVNVAEFLAMIEGLRFLAERPDITGPVVVRGDSKLVIQLARGRWRARKANMARLLAKAHKLTHRIGRKRLSYQWVPRAQNDACDRLSKEYRSTATDAQTEEQAAMGEKTKIQSGPGRREADRLASGAGSVRLRKVEVPGYLAEKLDVIRTTWAWRQWRSRTDKKIGASDAVLFMTCRPRILTETVRHFLVDGRAVLSTGEFAEWLEKRFPNLGSV